MEDKKMMAITRYIRNVRFYTSLNGDNLLDYGPSCKAKLGEIEEELKSKYGINEDQIHPKETFQTENGNIFIGSDALKNINPWRKP